MKILDKAADRFNSITNGIHRLPPEVKRRTLIAGTLLTVMAVSMAVLYAEFPEVLSEEILEATRFDFMLASSLTGGIAGTATVAFGFFAYKKVHIETSAQTKRRLLEEARSLNRQVYQ